MEEVTKRLEELAAAHEKKNAATKKVQTDSFQVFKKKCQEEIDELKAENLKGIEEFRTKAKGAMEELEDRQFKDAEHQAAIITLDFTNQLKEEHEELIKKKLKEQKLADKRAFEEMNEGETLMSEVDEEILKEKQKQDRKALKKQLKKAYEAELQEQVQKKNQEFALKQHDEIHALRMKLMAEEEELQKKLNKGLLDLQSRHMNEEHKMLRDNLESLQKSLEQQFDEEHALRVELAPVSSEIMIKKFTDGIDQIIAEKKASIDQEKAKAEEEFQEQLRKHKEHVAKLQAPSTAGVELTAEEKKKAFLTRKFNIEYTPPSEDKLKAQLAELTKGFEDFELDKKKLVANHKAKVEESAATQLSEHLALKAPLQQTHQSRFEKLIQFQKEERTKFDGVLAENARLFDEKWAQSKKDLIAQGEAERQQILNPPKSEAPKDEAEPAKEDPSKDD